LKWLAGGMSEAAAAVCIAGCSVYFHMEWISVPTE
jgi:hypothetical protein